MELSPIAREKLDKVGELSPEEKKRLKLFKELTFLLSDYFTNKLDVDELWLRLQQFKKDGNEFMIRETQLRLIDAISLGSRNTDFEQCRRAILGCETLKEQNKYTELELSMNTIESLRQQYQQEKEATFDSMKASIQSQVEIAARQLARQAINQNLSVDVESSAEASVRASPQWRDFMLKHEKTYGQRFNDCLSKIKKLI